MINDQFSAAQEKAGASDLKTEQLRNIKDVSLNILKTSRQFDVDANDDNSAFDVLVSSNCLQKSLESDNFIYIAGSRAEQQPEFISGEEFADIKDQKRIGIPSQLETVMSSLKRTLRSSRIEDQ